MKDKLFLVDSSSLQTFIVAPCSSFGWRVQWLFADEVSVFELKRERALQSP